MQASPGAQDGQKADTSLAGQEPKECDEEVARARPGPPKQRSHSSATAPSLCVLSQDAPSPESTFHSPRLSMWLAPGWSRRREDGLGSADFPLSSRSEVSAGNAIVAKPSTVRSCPRGARARRARAGDLVSIST